MQPSFLTKACNEISEKGCKHLSKTEWNGLIELDLCIDVKNKDKNNIGDRGCKNLRGAEWRQLQYLNMSSKVIIKVKMGLKSKVVAFFLSTNGIKSNQ